MKNSRVSAGGEGALARGVEQPVRQALSAPAHATEAAADVAGAELVPQIGAVGADEGGGRGSGFAPPVGGGESSSQSTGDFSAMAEAFEFRERDVAAWLGMPQSALKTARKKNAAGIALIGGWMMYDRSYLEGLLIQFGLAEKTGEGLALIEGLSWDALEEKTRAWASLSAASAKKTAGHVAKVVRHLMNPFLFLAEITDGPKNRERVNVTVKRKEERQKFKPGTVVEIEPLEGRPVWGIVKTK